MVKGGSLLRHIDWVQKRQQQDRCRQGHIARFGRQPRQDRPRLEVLEGVDEVVVAPAIYVEPGVPRCAKLRQVILPLLLVVDGIPVDNVANLVGYAHLSRS